MKFIKKLTLFFIILTAYSCNKNEKSTCKTIPEYTLIEEFSKKINEKTDLSLHGYGINIHLPKNYHKKNEVASFTVSYWLNMNKNDSVSIGQARNLMVFVIENLLQTINTNHEVKCHLSVYPFPRDSLQIFIRFKDENKIDLGHGVSEVYFSDGKIEYEHYEISEYTGHYPASGKHYKIHEESYAEALKIVKDQEALKPL